MSSRSEGSRDEGSRSDTPEVDFSVIRTAIKIGGKVIEQVMNGIHYGSAEVRNLLLEECDVILECKVCRNLFRGLPNFIAHKRVYCTETYEEHQKRENEEANFEGENNVVIEPVSPNETSMEAGALVTKSANSNQTVIEKVVNKTFDGQSNSYNFYTKIAEKVEAKKIAKPTSFVTLKSILSNPNAKVMTVTEKGQPAEQGTLSELSADVLPNENCIQKRTEDDVADTAGNVVAKIPRSKPTIGQLCEKLATRSPKLLNSFESETITSKTATVRPVRMRKSSPRKSLDSFIGMKDQESEKSHSKTPSPSSSRKETDTGDSEAGEENTDFSTDMKAFIFDNVVDQTWLVHCDIKTLMCKTCDKSFTTPYGLKFHCKMKHVDKMIQYPCPQCTKSFSYFTALARHLRKVHTKSESYIEFIQAKLKGKLGRRKSLDDTGTDSNDTEESPESLKKNMLALDTGWKKCDKCGKICWKAKSYYRHYQYCKGKMESNKSNSVESSPTKISSQKGHMKKANEKVQPNPTGKSETLKDKAKFNENLTIRTRKQAESMNQSVETVQKSPAITITITEPAEIEQGQTVAKLSNTNKKLPRSEIDNSQAKAELQVACNEQSSLPTQAIRQMVSESATEKANQCNLPSKGKNKLSPEKVMVTRKQILKNTPTVLHEGQSCVAREAEENIRNKPTPEKVELVNQSAVGKTKITGEKITPTGKLDLESKTAVGDTSIQVGKYIGPNPTVLNAEGSHILTTDTNKSQPEKVMVTRKGVLDSLQTEMVLEKDNVTKALQEALLNFNSSLDKSAEDKSNCKRHQNKDVSEESEVSNYSTKEVATEDSEESSRVYVRPVTRRSDGTLTIKDAKLDSHDKTKTSHQAVKSPNIAKSIKKPEERHGENEENSKIQTSGLKNMDNHYTKNILQNVMEKKELKNKNRNEAAAQDNKQEVNTDSNELKDLSVKIPDTPKRKDIESTRSSLDSPTWSDNPMSKFKMTVKEMAELVESASLSKFARERKKKAKQILNKKQNGANKSVQMKTIAKSAKSKTKKKPMHIVKKIYGTRLSTGSKSETDTCSAEQSREKGHRYATRNVDAKLSGETKPDEAKQLYSGVDKSIIAKVDMPSSEPANDESVTIVQQAKVLELATLNSKRKEFLAAKRDQRRKFLLANKTASPKKVSPEKTFFTRTRSSKESLILPIQGTKTSGKSPSPGSNEKKQLLSKKLLGAEANSMVNSEKRKLSLRSHEPMSSEASKQQSKTEKREENAKALDNQVLTKVLPSKNTGNVKLESMECEKMVNDANVCMVKARPSRYSTSPNQKNTHDHRSKSSSTERPRGTVVQKPTTGSLERPRNMQDSIGIDKPRRNVAQKLLKSESNNTASRSENVPVSEIQGLDAAYDKNKITLLNRELRQPNARQESTENSPFSVRKESDRQSETSGTDKTNLSVDNGSEEMGKSERVSEKTKDKHIISSNKEAENKQSVTHIHKTRLSTGSLSLFNKTAKSLLSSAEDFSGIDSKTKMNKKRKRNLSAPQDNVKPEPKRYSLLTGVIQCERCGKTFWKKTSYTAHIMKSPCGKKQRTDKKEMINGDLKEIGREGEKTESAKEETLALPDVSVQLIETPNDKYETNEKACKSKIKRPLPTSPKLMGEIYQSNEIFMDLTNSKRPRLDTEGENTDSFDTSNNLTDTENTQEKDINDVKKGPAINEIQKDTDVAELSNTVCPTCESAAIIPVEIPGTSKDFIDEDSDTGSEFSGFSEADLSYPKLPDDISDSDSDFSLKNEAEKDYNGNSSCCIDNISKDREIVLDENLTDMEKKNIMSVEGIWVEKQSGMQVIEKTKSNRIYVMNTDSSRKLHCQDKRNIDSFVDEDNLKCLRCNREFTSISNVRQHVIRHLGWKRYQCKVCTVFSCYNLSEIRMHLTRSHGIPVDSESEFQKHVKDLNKEAGKKRSSKRMKTIQKKKENEIRTGQGVVTKWQSEKKENNSVETTDYESNTDSNVIQSKSSHTEEEKDNFPFSAPSSLDRSKQTLAKEEESHKVLMEHEYGTDHVTEKDSSGLHENSENIEKKESNRVIQVEPLTGSTSPVKKSVRLAAKEDTRKSAVEILKGPRLPYLPKKLSSPPKTDGKKCGSPQKIIKPATKSAENDNTEDSSLLSKARQMLATVLK